MNEQIIGSKLILFLKNTVNCRFVRLVLNYVIILYSTASALRNQP